MAEPLYGRLPDLPPGGAARGHAYMMDRLYRDLLGRPPDAGGLGAYVAGLQAGKTIESIIAEFLSGDEFRGRGVAPPPDLAAYAAGLRALGGGACPVPPAAPVLSANDPVAYQWWIEAFEAPFRASLRGAAIAPARMATLIGAAEAEAPPGMIGAITAQSVAHGPILFADGATADLGEADWLVVLPAPCLLADTSFAEILACGADGAARLMIADEDCIGPDGTRRAPWFKCDADWQMTARPRGHDGLLALRRDLVEAVGLAWLRTALGDGEALLPRLAPMVPPAARRHIPRVLTHRIGAVAPVPARPAAPVKPGPGSAGMPAASVLIPTRERMDLLAPFIEDLLFRTWPAPAEIIVIDNGSREPLSRAYLDRLNRRDARCRVLPMPGLFNWAAANQHAAREASGEVLVFLNNDMRVLDPGWLAALVTEACRESTGIAGAALFYPDGRVQHAGMVLRDDGTAHHVMRHARAECRDYEDLLRHRRAVSAVTGACMAIRRTVLSAAGGLDTEHYRITCSDTDLCLRVAALGLDIIWTPEARLMHLELATRRADQDAEKALRAAAEQAVLAARWPEALRRDRFWSPNLAYTEGPPALACPPRWDTLAYGGP